MLTAYEDGTSRLNDSDLLDRAQALGRVLFTHDDDLLAEASFAGLIYAHSLRISIGACVRDLELVAEAATLDEMLNHVLFLPV